MDDNERANLVSELYQAWLIFNQHQPRTTVYDLAWWALGVDLIAMAQYEGLIIGPNLNLPPQ